MTGLCFKTLGHHNLNSSCAALLPCILCPVVGGCKQTEKKGCPGELFTVTHNCMLCEKINFDGVDEVNLCSFPGLQVKMEIV
jgi:hypothetical protein